MLGSHSSLLGLREALGITQGCTQGRCHRHWYGPSAQNLLCAPGAPNTAKIPSVGRDMHAGKALVWKQRGLRSLLWHCSPLLSHWLDWGCLVFVFFFLSSFFAFFFLLLFLVCSPRLLHAVFTTDPNSCNAPIKSTQPRAPCSLCSSISAHGAHQDPAGGMSPCVCPSPSPPAPVPACSSVPAGCSQLR